MEYSNFEIKCKYIVKNDESYTNLLNLHNIASMLYLQPIRKNSN